MIPTGKGVYIWNLSTCRAALGTDQAILDKVKWLGCEWVYPKVGNGYYAWPNLLPFVELCHANQLKVGGWWYLYGNIGERDAIKNQIKALPLDAFLYDAEGHFENCADPAARAREYTADVRALRPTLPQILNSWWKPTVHPKQPWGAWLQGVDAVMPQVYPMQDTSPTGPESRLKVSLSEYRAKGWSGPVLVAGAAFHEAGWSSSVAQINNSHEAAVKTGCVGEAWWVFDQWVAENKADWMNAVRAHSWTAEPTLEEKVARLWAAHPEVH